MYRPIACIVPLVCLSLVSCVSTAHLGAISTRNIDYSAYYMKSNLTQQSATVAMVFCIPVMMEDVNMVEIIDLAMKREGYDFLTDVKISNTTVITYIFNCVNYTVLGTGWKKVGMATSANENSVDKYAYAVSKENGKYKLRKMDLN
jgi:hypothetical protein